MFSVKPDGIYYIIYLVRQMLNLNAKSNSIGLSKTSEYSTALFKLFSVQCYFKKLFYNSIFDCLSNSFEILIFFKRREAIASAFIISYVGATKLFFMQYRFSHINHSKQHMNQRKRPINQLSKHWKYRRLFAWPSNSKYI